MNYNSTDIGDPYVRVPLVEIKYPAPGVANIRIIEDLAIKAKDGSIKHLETLGQLEWSITPSDMGKSLQLVHPDTGDAIPGATMTYQQLMLGLLAAIRYQQNLRDTPPLVPEE